MIKIALGPPMAIVTKKNLPIATQERFKCKRMALSIMFELETYLFTDNTFEI